MNSPDKQRAINFIVSLFLTDNTSELSRAYKSLNHLVDLIELGDRSSCKTALGARATAEYLQDDVFWKPIRKKKDSK